MDITVQRDIDRLYRLLPAMYREADVAQGYPLRALLRLVGEQADLLHVDIQQLWDNFFIETCARWATPYIGELVANNLLHDVDPAEAAQLAESLFLPDLVGPNLRPPAVIRQRADVAKTIFYRRRKGTLQMLEQLARDVTGWAAHAVEFFEQLTWTQNLNHLRLASTDGPDVRQVDADDRVQGSFDGASHTVDVRRIGQAEGWYNIRNIGFFLWRLRSYPVERVPARLVSGCTWRYTFSPLGDSPPLFSAGLGGGDEVALTTELHVPAPIRPAAFFEDLRRFAHAPLPLPDHTDYYGDPAHYPEWSLAVLEDRTTVNAVHGVATFGNLSIDQAGIGYTLQATATGLTGATSAAFDITATPPSPPQATQLGFLQQPSTTQAGQVITPAVQVAALDPSGNLATGFTGPITIALGANPGAGTLSGTRTVNAVHGVATFGDLHIDTPGIGYTLQATATGLTAASSGAFDITATPLPPAQATHLGFTRQPSTTQAGQVITPAVQGAALDASGNVVASFTGPITIALGTNPAGGTLSAPAPVPPQDIDCVNLDGWDGLRQPPGDKIGIDVSRGRLAVGQDRPSHAIRVSYHYGFSADLGSGPYDRTKWLVRERPGQVRFNVGGARSTHATLGDALRGWAGLATPRPHTVITIYESGPFGDYTAIGLDAAGSLVIQAQTGVRPHIRGDITVTGPGSGLDLTLSGLLVEGAVVVTRDMTRLRLLHSTLVPGRSIVSGTPSVDISDGGASPINTALRVEIAYSITGSLLIPAQTTGLWLLDSIVDVTRLDGQSRPAIADATETSGPPATIERATILGPSFFRKLLLASETIFAGNITVEQQQEGCVRFSFVPPGSAAPQQYRCQPALEIAAHPGVPADRIATWLYPRFEALEYGLPTYAQLRLTTPAQILRGAADGAEMGAFNHLKQPQRETNLRVRLDEYLPFGLEAGLVYVT